MFLALLLACGGDVIQHTDTSDDEPPGPVSILALDPDSGPAAGGTLVRITGEGYTTASTVTVQGQPCATLTFLSSSELYCSTPPGTVGDTTVRVVEGPDEASASFTYLEDQTDTGDTGDAPPEITACTLDQPLSMTVEAELDSEPVLGSVTIPTRTEPDGEPLGVEAEVGYGASPTDLGTWAWERMDWAAQAGDGDQYTGSFRPTREGAYYYGVRFRVDHREWVTCPASSGAYGEVQVTEPISSGLVDYCHLQWPCAITVPAGTETETLYAWVYHGGVTQGMGRGGGVDLELGFGPAGSAPSTWTWTGMAYNADKDGLMAGDLANDEYAGRFVAPATAGAYDYAARATVDGGASWTICDLGGDSCNEGGSSDGYDNPGICTVE